MDIKNRFTKSLYELFFSSYEQAEPEQSQYLNDSDTVVSMQKRAEILPPSDFVFFTLPDNIVVDGALICEENTFLSGNIKCDIIGLKTVIVNANLVGSIAAKELQLVGGTVQGMVVADLVVVDNHSMLVGELETKNLINYGRINSIAKVLQLTHLKKGSLIIGELETGNIKMQQGASLRSTLKLGNL